jgi:hypothetical protein
MWVAVELGKSGWLLVGYYRAQCETTRVDICGLEGNKAGHNFA